MNRIFNILLVLKEKNITVWESEGKLNFRAPKGVNIESELKLMKQHKSEIVEFLKNESDLNKINIEPEKKYESFPLTDVQTAYLLGRKDVFDYGSVACHIYMEYEYEDLEPEKATICWNKLIQRHEMLRTVFSDNEGTQKVLETVPKFEIVYRDISEMDTMYANQYLENVRDQMGQRVYDASKWPIFDIRITKTKNNVIMHFSMEFLIADWMSMQILVSEFETIYAGKEKRLPELSLTFRDYVVFQFKQRNSLAYIEDKEYWMKRIQELPGAPSLPRIGNKQDRVYFSRWHLELAHRDWDKIKVYAKKISVTPTSVVLAAYAAVLERWSENSSFCLNLTLLNRQPLHKEIEYLVGDFTDVVILNIDWRNQKAFSEHVVEIQKQLFNDLDHRLFSGVEVMREISREFGAERALMPYVFTSAIGVSESSEIIDIKGKQNSNGISQTPQVFIDCQVADDEEGLKVNWDVRQGIFPENMVADMFRAFEEILYKLSFSFDNWEEKEIVALPKFEIDLFKKVNDTKECYDIEPLHKPVVRNFKKYSDYPAVIDSEGIVTYKELERLSFGIATELLVMGCAYQDRIAIDMEKSRHQIAAVLGVLMIGAIYVPIDTNQPHNRKRKIFEDSNVKCVILNHMADDEKNIVPVIDVTSIIQKEQYELPDPVNEINSLAYIIYTSGSTGMPKGVAMSHGAASNTIIDINRRFGISEKDRVLSLSKLSFDLSVYDIFGMLSVGGTIVLPENGKESDPSHWFDLITKNHVTIWNTVPAMMQMLSDYIAVQKNMETYPMRLALLSGDWIPVKLPGIIERQFSNIKVVSLGGATEAGIWSNYYLCEEIDDSLGSVPYGKPLSNQYFKILDKKMRMCPLYVSGELYIGGQSLADCYYNDTYTTSSHFIDYTENERLYKTGDYGYYKESGDIIFQGRRDEQVKLRGYRIELGEVEAALQKNPLVKQAAVVINKAGAEATLNAFIKLQDDAESINTFQLSNITQTQIKELYNDIFAEYEAEKIALANSILEEYVLYSILEYLKENHLTQNKKIDFSLMKQKESIKSEYHWLIKRWLDKLCECGKLVSTNEDVYELKSDNINEKVKIYRESLYSTWNNEIMPETFILYIEENLKQISGLLSGKVNPVDILYPYGEWKIVRDLYINSKVSHYINSCIEELIQNMLSYNNERTIRILEIGAGTGAVLEKISGILEKSNIEYYFSDVSSFFITTAKAKYQHPNIKFGIYNIDEDYRKQGLLPNMFDMIIAVEVVENAKNIPYTMQMLKELIAPKGWLVLSESVIEPAWILASQAFLMQEPQDDLRKNTSYLGQSDWIKLLMEIGEGDMYSWPEQGSSIDSFGIRLFAKQVKKQMPHYDLDEIKDGLKKELAGYMIPSNMQVIDSLPLTANRKIDRRVLERWSDIGQFGSNSQQEEIISDERSEEQKKIEKIFKDSLGVDAIEWNRSFYEYGADSLIIAQIAGKIMQFLNEEQGMDIPYDVILRQLLNQSTLEKFEEFVDTYGTKNADDGDDKKNNYEVIRYIESEEETACVLFHGGLGTLDNYRNLVKYLQCGEQIEVIGFAIKDSFKYCKISPENLYQAISLEYAAYIQKRGIKKVQLVGHCIGGRIAVEVARILSEKGIKIVDVVLIDSVPLMSNVPDDSYLELMFPAFLNISFKDMGLTDLSTTEIMNEMILLLEGDDKADNRLKKLLDKLKTLDETKKISMYADTLLRLYGKRIPNDMVKSMLNAFIHSSKGAKYEPEPYIGDIRLLLAKEQYFPVRNLTEKAIQFWKDICIGNLQTMTILGNHFTCIEDEKNAAMVANLILKHI